ncbi:MAG: hypothetical protein E5X84_38050, partial [Mesorhizobium sp.]
VEPERRGQVGIARPALVAEIDEGRPRDANLSSALRLYVLDWAKRGMKPV